MTLRYDSRVAIVTGAGGSFARVKYLQSQGVQFDPASPVTPEMFIDALPGIMDLSAPVDHMTAFKRLEDSLKAIGRG